MELISLVQGRDPSDLIYNAAKNKLTLKNGFVGGMIKFWEQKLKLSSLATGISSSSLSKSQ